ARVPRVRAREGRRVVRPAHRHRRVVDRPPPGVLMDKAIYQERWDRLQGLMEAEELDALIVAARGVIGAFGNVFYLCGYTPLLRVSYGVLHREREPILFLPSHAD